MKDIDASSLLRQIKEDYLKAIYNNNSENVEEFIEQFLYDSWEYNEQNLEKLKDSLGDYSSGNIDNDTFRAAFKDMIDPIQRKLEELDADIHYPMIHTTRGASFLVAFVDGLVIQYYVGVYKIDQLKEMTPHLTSIILNGFKSKPN
ncbi:hypothetical protein ACIQLG_16305 [Terribacillus saccharophilus]|uniref:hypothetical protein n=1 Tax=Terribacillus saccharophilus TaxID=361277 RepID=UPI0037F6570B